MTNNPGTWWQGIAALCRWGLAWLSIGQFTLLAGINLLRTAFMERILPVAQCIVLAVWALPNGAAGLLLLQKGKKHKKPGPVPFGTGPG